MDRKKETKTIEKVIEKESEKEAQQIVDIKLIANDLALNIIKANKETNLYIDKYGDIQIGLIDKKGLKQLTSVLKNLNEILEDKQADSKTDLNKEITKLKKLGNILKKRIFSFPNKSFFLPTITSMNLCLITYLRK